MENRRADALLGTLLWVLVRHELWSSCLYPELKIKSGSSALGGDAGGAVRAWMVLRADACSECHLQWSLCRRRKALFEAQVFTWHTVFWGFCLLCCTELAQSLICGQVRRRPVLGMTRCPNLRLTAALGGCNRVCPQRTVLDQHVMVRQSDERVPYDYDLSGFARCANCKDESNQPTQLLCWDGA
jgi:hypothetical protein